jgi:hypothetical protein
MQKIVDKISDLLSSGATKTIATLGFVPPTLGLAFKSLDEKDSFNIFENAGDTMPDKIAPFQKMLELEKSYKVAAIVADSFVTEEKDGVLGKRYEAVVIAVQARTGETSFTEIKYERDGNGRPIKPTRERKKESHLGGRMLPFPKVQQGVH